MFVCDVCVFVCVFVCFCVVCGVFVCVECVCVCESALLSITLLVGVTELHPNLKQSIIIGCNPPVSIIIETCNN